MSFLKPSFLAGHRKQAPEGYFEIPVVSCPTQNNRTFLGRCCRSWKTNPILPVICQIVSTKEMTGNFATLCVGGAAE
jgi:hypothetical protein